MSGKKIIGLIVILILAGIAMYMLWPKADADSTATDDAGDGRTLWGGATTLAAFKNLFKSKADTERNSLKNSSDVVPVATGSTLFKAGADKPVSLKALADKK